MRQHRSVWANVLCLLTVAGSWLLPVGSAGAQSGPSPRLFAPGAISGPADDLSPAFSPDGKTVVFTGGNPSAAALFISHLEHGHWSNPELAPFSGAWIDIEPAMAPDGSFLVFASNRPSAAGDPPLTGHYNGRTAVGRGGNLWRVDRLKNGGWSTPERLPDAINRSDATFSPSVAADGSIYFMSPDSSHGSFHLYRSQHLSNGTYAAALELPLGDSTSEEVDPAVAADERYLIYSSMHPHHAERNRLHIVFRCGAGWGRAIDLGDEVNEKGGNIEARLSPNDRVLYFSTNTVPPVTFPRARSDALRDEEQSEVWANGSQNIWYVPLDFVLSGSAQRSSCGSR